MVYDDFFGSGGDNAEKQRKPPKKKSVHFEESDFEDELDEEEEDLSEWRSVLTRDVALITKHI